MMHETRSEWINSLWMNSIKKKNKGRGKTPFKKEAYTSISNTLRKWN